MRGRNIYQKSAGPIAVAQSPAITFALDLTVSEARPTSGSRHLTAMCRLISLNYSQEYLLKGEGVYIGED